MQTRTRRHVDDFLMTVDARGSVVRIAEEIAAAAEHDDGVRTALADVIDWISGPVIDRDSFDLYERVAHRRARLEFLDGPAETTLLAVTHVRAVHALRQPAVEPSRVLAGVPQAMKVGADMLRRLERGFVGQLLVESELRAARDETFAARLDAAVDDVRWVHRQVAPLAGGLVRLLSDAVRQAGAPDDAAVRAARTIDAQAGAAVILSAYVVGVVIGKQAASA